MSSSSSSHQHLHCHNRTLSEPHSYNIQAKLRNSILSIFVHDTVTNLQWRQEFTQISFPGHKLYDVAKALIMAIQEMINSSKEMIKNINNNININNKQQQEPKPIAILVYNQWCYLTIHGSNLPSFALRPIEQSKNKKIKQNEESQTIQESPYGFNTNKQLKNIKFGDIQRDKRINHNIKFKNNDNTKVIGKGLVARNIAKIHKQEKQNKNKIKIENQNTNKTKTPYSNSSNSRKNCTKKGNHIKIKKNKPSKPIPSTPPLPQSKKPEKQNPHPMVVTNNNQALPALPTLPTNRSSPFPSRPLPILPVAQKMTVKNMGDRDDDNHNYSSSVKFGHNLAPSMESRHSASYQHQPYIPAPPAPKKVLTISRKNSNEQPQIPQYEQPQIPQYKKQHSIPIPTSSLIGNRSNSSSILSGISDVSGIDVMGSDDDINININTDDEDSSSYNININGSSHSNHASMDSNTGSLDSLFTNDGGNRFNSRDSSIAEVNSNNTFFNNGSYESASSKSIIPEKKMRLFNVMTNIDNGQNMSDDEEFCSDLFDCNYTGNNDETQSRFRSKKMRSDNNDNNHKEGKSKKNKPLKKKPLKKPKKKPKKKGKKSKKKKNNKPIKPLTILLNGDVIDDMISHVIEQQIAEEEYYEEEDQLDEQYYDPDFLGISPYYDD